MKFRKGDRIKVKNGTNPKFDGLTGYVVEVVETLALPVHVNLAGMHGEVDFRHSELEMICRECGNDSDGYSLCEKCRDVQGDINKGKYGEMM